MTITRVLLAEDHTIVRKGLLALLSPEEDIEVCGEVGTGKQAVKAVGALAPDVAILDITMPELSGLEAARRIRKRYPEAQILFLTMHANEAYLREALLIGASGFVLKRAAPEELILAIRAAARGQTFVSPALSSALVEGYKSHLKSDSGNELEALTSREREVLQLIAEGRTSSQIADSLHISVKTVLAHRSNLMGKLQAHCTADLVKYAIRTGLTLPDF